MSRLCCVQWDVEVMPRLASLHQGGGLQKPGGSTLRSRRAAGAAPAMTQPAYQLDVCLPRLRLSSHPLLPREVWLVRILWSFLVGPRCGMHAVHTCIHRFTEDSSDNHSQANDRNNHDHSTEPWNAADPLGMLPFAQPCSSVECDHAFSLMPPIACLQANPNK